MTQLSGQSTDRQPSIHTGQTSSWDMTKVHWLSTCPPIQLVGAKVTTPRISHESQLAAQQETDVVAPTL